MLTPPIDSPPIVNRLGLKLGPQTSPKLHLPSVLNTPSTGGSSQLSPFPFLKHPFEGVAASQVFAPNFGPAFPSFGSSGPGGGGGHGTGNPVSLFQRQFSAPANLQGSSSFGTPHDLSPLIFDGHQLGSNNGHPPEIAKSRRGRKPANYVPPPSEPSSPSIGMFDGGSLFGNGSDRSESPKSDSASHHACGANGWLTTAGSGANCRKRCQNLYHAAKYRDRRRQRMEQLYTEKDALEKNQNLYLSKISSLKMQICSLITQRTQHHSANGTITYRCPVCRAVYFDVEQIRSHLSTEHHEDLRKANGINEVATVASIDPQDLAIQFRTFTKDWLSRTGNGNGPGPGEQSPGPSSGLLVPKIQQAGKSGPLFVGGNGVGLAMPMIPFN